MRSDELRAIQAPLKERYRDDVLHGDRTRIPGAVRASCGLSTTDADVARLLDAVSIIASGEPAPVDYQQDPATGDFAGPDAYSQARQIVRNFRLMLEAAGATLADVMQVSVYLKRVQDFAEMNRGYAEEFGDHRPARTVICVADLPKAGALMTMDLTALQSS